jgi:hypothetical protein
MLPPPFRVVTTVTTNAPLFRDKKMPYSEVENDYKKLSASDYQIGGSHYKKTIQPWLF